MVDNASFGMEADGADDGEDPNMSHGGASPFAPPTGYVLTENVS